ncbi:DUF2523 family protein [uncultured Oxalicibacterium sp.]|uniref:DUF2523 family protein n=1 Tax=uncultured Oxalicibacterium sp. TaxID=1168540 RepID=UPI0025EFB156|nr:DUF2523 family protein [uncultured Oxalicibacterium sp.]
MPLIIASLLGGLLQLAASMVGRVLLALGMSFFVFTGFNIGFDFLKNIITSNMTGMGADVMGILGFLWVDKAISLILSAYTAALAIKLAGSDSVTKLVTK